MKTLSELWFPLTPVQRRSAVVLLGLMLVGMVLETLGIGLVVPALALMLQGDVVARHPMLAPWLIRIGNPDREQLIIYGVLFLVAVYAAKVAFLTFLTWRQLSYVAAVQVDISQRLLAGYLRQPYGFHLRRNSSELMRNVISEVSVFNAGMTSVLGLLSEGLVVAGIAGLLLTFEPFGAVMVLSTIGLAGWGFHRLTRRHILLWGEARQRHDGLRTQRLLEALGGAKDVKLLGRESNFLAQYQHHNTGRALVEKRQLTVQSLPRLLLELLVVTGLAALVLVVIAQGKPVEYLVPTIGLFAAAAFRLMPSANRILGSVQAVRYLSPGIHTVCEEIRQTADVAVLPRSSPMLFTNDLTLDDVTFQYPSTATSALEGISLTIPKGSSVGFIGSSGAGKSTLVDIILGLFTPSSGTVRVDGTDIQTNLRGWQDLIGYVPQSIFLTDDTIRRNIAFGLPDEHIDEAAVQRAMRAAQLEEFISTLPQGLDTLVGERGVRISGGQRQRIGIARALYHDPEVLVLDEATSALDTATEREVMATVNSLHPGKTLIIVAHRLSTVEQCDCLFRLSKGRVVEVIGETAVRAVAGA